MATSASDVEARAREPMAYFSHDANAAQDIKCQRLLARWGNEGYGAWWRLCEMLANTTGHALPTQTEEDWGILARQIGMLGTVDDGFEGTEKCRALVHDLLDVGLLVNDKNGQISSLRMQRNASFFGKQRANGSSGGRPRKSEQGQENSR